MTMLRLYCQFSCYKVSECFQGSKTLKSAMTAPQVLYSLSQWPLGATEDLFLSTGKKTYKHSVRHKVHLYSMSAAFEYSAKHQNLPWCHKGAGHCGNSSVTWHQFQSELWRLIVWAHWVPWRGCPLKPSVRAELTETTLPLSQPVATRWRPSTLLTHNDPPSSRVNPVSHSSC